MTATILNFPIMPQYPNRIAEQRIARGLSQAALAHLIGAHSSQISHLETGKRSLTIDWMQRIASALDLQAADLLLARDNSASLSEEEADLIAQFRAASSSQRQQIRALADVIVPYIAEPADAERQKKSA